MIVRNITFVIAFFCLQLSYGQEYIEVEYEEVIIWCLIAKQNTFIIDNEQDYKAILNTRSHHPDCINYVLPEFNFDEYLLVGIIYTTHGCSIDSVQISVRKEIRYNKYEVNLSFNRIGNCERNNAIIRWIKVNTPPENYQIVFNVNNYPL